MKKMIITLTTATTLMTAAQLAAAEVPKPQMDNLVSQEECKYEPMKHMVVHHPSSGQYFVWWPHLVFQDQKIKPTYERKLSDAHKKDYIYSIGKQVGMYDNYTIAYEVCRKPASSESF